MGGISPANQNRDPKVKGLNLTSVYFHVKSFISLMQANSDTTSALMLGSNIVDLLEKSTNNLFNFLGNSFDRLYGISDHLFRTFNTLYDQAIRALRNI
jgi:hypothetical protein